LNVENDFELISYTQTYTNMIYMKKYIAHYTTLHPHLMEGSFAQLLLKQHLELFAESLQQYCSVI
jgi:hypothetical protein